MECRNCRHHLHDGDRYCPRCGAPTTMWPTAGAPWLRRPAAVGGLAVLLIAWLVALQRQVWQPTHAPPKRNRNGGLTQIAGLPSIKKQPLVEGTSGGSAISAVRETDRSLHGPATRTHGA